MALEQHRAGGWLERSEAQTPPEHSETLMEASKGGWLLRLLLQEQSAMAQHSAGEHSQKSEEFLKLFIILNVLFPGA